MQIYNHHLCAWVLELNVFEISRASVQLVTIYLYTFELQSF